MSDTEHQSLYEYIRAAIEPLRETGVLPDFSLPSDPGSSIPFADGAQDGIAVYHMGASEIPDETKALMAKAVQTAVKGDIEAAEQLFIELGKSTKAIWLIDELQDYIIANRDTIPAGELFKFAVYAAGTSSDRECVKFGLSILELLNIEDNEQIKSMVTVLGLCDEFTLFSIFVMLRWADGNENIAYLARLLHGWGRIHAIERLDPNTEAIRKWLLREGVHNTVMPAYSALTCWNKSGAAELLFGDSPLSDEDRAGMRDIITALLGEGPVDGISALDNGDDILAEFLKKTSECVLDIDDLNAVLAIKNYAENNADLIRLCDEILNTDTARGLVAAAVKNGEAIDLAVTLGIDCREDIMGLLERDFEKSAHLCRYLMDDRYRPRVIEIFRKKLPLNELIAEPSDEPRFGGNELNLVYLVQMLGEYPLEGTDLVEISLQCAPPQNRNMALRVLKSWVERKNTTLRELLPDTYELVCGLRAGEVNKSAAQSMDELIF
ncbi:MAG: hypothetical protein K2J80_10285 [Oscillospiraceae bacterium]|nr:hypothetical protein [Oscillospiraceae bacterium]